jgi:hypothetical protein
MFVPFVQLVPEVKNYEAFGDSISSSVDENLVHNHISIWDDRRRLRRDNLNVAIVVLPRPGDFYGSSMLFRDSALGWLGFLSEIG